MTTILISCPLFTGSIVGLWLLRRWLKGTFMAWLARIEANKEREGPHYGDEYLLRQLDHEDGADK